MCLNNGHLSDIFRTFIGQSPPCKFKEKIQSYLKEVG